MGWEGGEKQTKKQREKYQGQTQSKEGGGGAKRQNNAVKKSEVTVSLLLEESKHLGMNSGM